MAIPTVEESPTPVDHRVHHVCIPRLSLPDLVLIMVEFHRRKYRRVTIHYDRAARVLNGLAAVGGPAPKTVLKLIEKIIPKLRFVPIRHSSQHVNYPELFTKAEEDTTAVMFEQLPMLKSDPAFRWYEGIIGEEPTLSFLARSIAYRAVQPAFEALTPCTPPSPDEPYKFWLPLGWPAELGKAAIQHLEGNYELIAPQRRARWLFQYGASLRIMVWSSLIFMSFVRRRKISLRSPVPKNWKLANEFIDDGHLAGQSDHSDGMVDGTHIQGSDFLLFLTHSQEKYLGKRQGKKARDLAKAAVDKRGYHLAVLNELAYPLTSVWEAFRLLVRLNMHLLRSRATLVTMAAPEFFENYLDFLTLFIWHHPENILYSTLPNGTTNVRTNSGVLTGLSRRHNVTSNGLQTRSFFLRRWEDSLDCFDRYFYWGKRFRDYYKPLSDRFLGTSEIVGNINIDTDFVASTQLRREANQSGHKSLLAFIAEVSPPGPDLRHHYTFQYNLQFVKLMARFARDNPQVEVQIKLKDTFELDYLQSDALISRYVRTDEIPNFRFLSLERGIFRSALGSADVVSAMGFTSPGTDALVLGKPTVFYSQLGKDTSHFVHLPGLVATEDDQFIEMLQQAVDDPEGVIRIQQGFVRDLDPYCDGRAMERIATSLAGGAGRTHAEDGAPLALEHH